MLATGWRRGARAWATAVAVMLLSIALLKLVFVHCDRAGGLGSPSGHTASAALIYGGGAALLLRLRTPAAAALAGLAAAIIGATRLALHLHSPADVLAGAAIGIACATLLAHLAGPRPRAQPLRYFAPEALAAMVLLHGMHLHLEEAIRRLAIAWLHPPGC